MGRSTHVLLLGFEPHDSLGDRLRRLDFHPVAAATLEDGLRSLESWHAPIRAGLLPSRCRFPDLPQALRLLRERSVESDLQFLVVGRRPDPAQIERLRQAGIRLALWTPFNDTELRFLVNHVLYNPKRGEARLDARVPTKLDVRVLGGPVEKVAHLYNVSLGGAYLATERPTPVGGEVFVELPLPSRTTTLHAVVVSNNVVGNLEKERLPRGMGVQFREMEEATREALSEFIEECSRAYQL